MQLGSDSSVYLKVRTKTLEVDRELIGRLMFLLCSQRLKPVRKGSGISILFSPFASDAVVCSSFIQKWQRNSSLLWGPHTIGNCNEFVTRLRLISEMYRVKGKSFHRSPPLKYLRILKVSSWCKKSVGQKCPKHILIGFPFAVYKKLL